MSWETVIEATYRIVVTPILALHSDFQCVIRPDGDRHAKGAAFPGMRWDVTF